MASIFRFLLFNLLLSTTIIFSLMAIGNFLSSDYSVQKHLDNHMMQITNILDYFCSQSGCSQKTATLSTHNDTDPYEFLIWNKSGQLLLRSKRAPNFSPPDHNGFSDQTIDGIDWRVYTRHQSRLKLTITILQHLSARDSLDKTICWDHFIILFFSYPTLGFSIWFIVRRSLKGLRKLASLLSERQVTDFSPVSLHGIPVEARPLVKTLNTLFLRLYETFKRNRRFSGDAAHELRTPLAALKIQAQATLLNLDNRKEQIKGLEKVISGTNRCVHIVQQLLALSRFDASTTLKNVGDIDLSKIAMEIIAQLAPLALKKGIDIAMNASNDKTIICGNETALIILIRNLVDNAIRYTPNNGKVEVCTMSQNSTVVLRVTDTGPGIPVELHKRVFERFYRIIGTQAAGSGLGLAIVKEIALLHKATIKLEYATSSGKGLVVSVSFPAV